MILGKIVKSNSHTDYVCQIYGPGEVETPPAPADYAFGSFVHISLGASYGHLIGVIYDTMLLNPDFGNLGPRLSTAQDLAIFSPDYLAEKVTLVGITVVGMVSPADAPLHGVSPLAAQIDALVERLDTEAVRAFHQTPGGGVQIGYAPLLLALGSPLARHLVLHLVAYLEQLFPAQAATLTVLRQELAWQTAIGPLGGVQ